MSTESESTITKINTNIFFKEFTFDKNDFFPEDGKKELADNFIFLDNIIFIFQIKERNRANVKSATHENKWFESSVLKDAKNQIKSSLNYLQKYNEITIINIRNHSVTIKGTELSAINKVIIYVPNSDLISDANRNIKFYESQEVGNIHIFHIEDYYWICRFLITPSELDEYLKFRERIYMLHKDVIKIFPEQYVLSHFLNTPDESIIKEEYIETLSKFVTDIEEFDMSGILNNFFENIHLEEQRQSQDYYKIIREIAKLNRVDLGQFKERFLKIFKHVQDNSFSPPFRFYVPRTGCGFVFIPLTLEKSEFWQNALINFIELYKYKRKLSKCIGLVMFRSGEYFDLQWGYVEYVWTYDDIMEKEMIKDFEIYGEGKVMQPQRYKFKDR